MWTNFLSQSVNLSANRRMRTHLSYLFKQFVWTCAYCAIYVNFQLLCYLFPLAATHLNLTFKQQEFLVFSWAIWGSPWVAYWLYWKLLGSIINSKQLSQNSQMQYISQKMLPCLCSVAFLLIIMFILIVMLLLYFC